MDTPLHESLYAQGYEMRKKVVGEDYVAKALENGSGDFMRPLQQLATVVTSFHLFFRP
jgi:4-carboxymuconolactone decarboxylase